MLFLFFFFTFLTLILNRDIATWLPLVLCSLPVLLPIQHFPGNARKQFALELKRSNANCRRGD